MFSLSLAVVLASGLLARAQITGTFPATPLASKHFPSPTDLPYQVDPDSHLVRGPQSGYNICNSTTEGPESLCQTSWVNGIDDFCLWSSPKPNETIGDTEGETVAYCTKQGHGTRLIPAGALQGVQYMITPAYRQVVGYIDQTLINLQADDFGGELDSGGQDNRGNPIGGIMYSTNITDGQTTQIINWSNFMGGSAFCIKVCDPANPDAENFCKHTLDRIGCAFNAPNNAQNGTFEVCHGDNGDFPGVYTSNGVVSTYTQPPESLGPITSMPYTPVVPSSSNCVTMTSAQIYTGLPTPSGASNTAASSGASRPAATAAGQGSSTATAGGAGSTNSPNDASALAISGISILGVVFASLFLS
jgi:hypothetical protein